MSKDETITLKKETLWKGLFFVAVIVILYLVFAGGTSAPTVAANNNAPSVDSAQAAAKGVTLTAEDHVLGDANAPVTVIEFSDFECPFCARAFYGAVTELKASSEFQNGEINFVYKQFPLNSIHPKAQKAAEASECAGEQGAFWEYHDLLFANQGALAVADLKGYAADLGLNTANFNDCLDSGDKAQKVSDDTEAAVASGGRGTPFFVIQNNDDGSAYPVSGAVPFSEIQKGITAVA